ncbi:hypothetical protein A2U01_0040192, partial [Trifolium medium]|nr:hypothetical protein [Trifolium medium]
MACEARASVIASKADENIIFFQNLIGDGHVCILVKKDAAERQSIVK